MSIYNPIFGILRKSAKFSGLTFKAELAMLFLMQTSRGKRFSETPQEPNSFVCNSKWIPINIRYDLALAALSQQAIDAGLSPTEWIAQLSADADDGVLDGAALTSAQAISAAVDKIMRSEP